MKAFVLAVILIVGASAQEQTEETDIDPCKTAFDACEELWLKVASSATDSETKCTNARTWESCLKDAAETGVCDGTEECPESLSMELDTYCALSQADECVERQNECKATWESSSKSEKEPNECELAKAWQSCNEENVAVGHCEKIPSETIEEVDRACGTNQEVECDAKVKACEEEWTAKYSDGHPNSVKCTLAEDWARCLNSAVVAPECHNSAITYPEELAIQSAFCYADEDVDECQVALDACRDSFSDKLASSNQGDSCAAAQGWTNCLAEPSVHELCLEGVPTPAEVTEALNGACTDQETDESLSCSEQEAKCGSEYQLPVDEMTSDRCEAASNWEKCLEGVKAKGCEVVTPVILEFEKAAYCADGEDDTCPSRIAHCKADFDLSDPAADRCQQAKTWEKCLTDLIGVCHIQSFPVSLMVLKATSCYQSQKTDCVVKQTECQSDFDAQVAITGESCDLATTWRSCIDALVDSGNCETSTYPEELTKTEEDTCSVRPGTLVCGDEQAKCKDAFDNADKVNGDECAQAREWRECLNKLIGSCVVTYPIDLNIAEAVACYAAQESSDPQETLTCEEKLENCKPASASSCDDAKTWRACLEGYMGECTVSFPMDLNILEATTCYASSDDSGSDDSLSCDAKVTNCEPAGASSCDDANSWRSCLVDLMGQCTVSFPMELNVLEATTCFASGSSGSSDSSSSSLTCDEKMAQCEPKDGSTCSDAKSWRSCLEGLMGECIVAFPVNLNILEATTCYASGSSGSSDSSSSSLTCDEKMAQCEPKDGSTCSDANSWRSCLEGLMGECIVAFPVDLNILEATTCYGK